MPITIARCLRCGTVIIYTCNPCNRCKQIDNTFCQGCHEYNCRRSFANKLGVLDDLRRASS